MKIRVDDIRKITTQISEKGNVLHRSEMICREKKVYNINKSKWIGGTIDTRLTKR